MRPPDESVAQTDERPGGQAEALRDHGTADAGIVAPGLHAVQIRGALDLKRYSNAQARAALAGFAVDHLEADDGSSEFTITRWAFTRRCRSLDELEAALRCMGVAL